VNREFKAPAPNILWAADFTYVRTAVGFVYVAFIIDVFARYIVGWKFSSSPNAQMVLDALNQALAACQPDPKTLIHHSDRGVQYLSIKYTERLEEAKIDPSVGSVGDRYNNTPFGGDLNRSMQHTVRTSLLASDIARSCEAVR
jgi:putative transposase